MGKFQSNCDCCFQRNKKEDAATCTKITSFSTRPLKMSLQLNYHHHHRKDHHQHFDGDAPRSCTTNATRPKILWQATQQQDQRYYTLTHTHDDDAKSILLQCYVLSVGIAQPEKKEHHHSFTDNHLPLLFGSTHFPVVKKLQIQDQQLNYYNYYDVSLLLLCVTTSA